MNKDKYFENSISKSDLDFHIPLENSGLFLLHIEFVFSLTAEKHGRRCIYTDSSGHCPCLRNEGIYVFSPSPTNEKVNYANSWPKKLSQVSCVYSTTCREGQYATLVSISLPSLTVHLWF